MPDHPYHRPGPGRYRTADEWLLRRIPAKTLLLPLFVFGLTTLSLIAHSLLTVPDDFEYVQGITTWTEGAMTLLFGYIICLMIGGFLYLPAAMAALYFAKRKKSMAWSVIIPHAVLLVLYLGLWSIRRLMPEDVWHLGELLAYPAAVIVAGAVLYANFRYAETPQQPEPAFRREVPMSVILKPFGVFVLIVTGMSLFLYAVQGLPMMLPARPGSPQVMPLALLATSLLESCILYLPVACVTIYKAGRTPSLAAAVWKPAAIAMCVYLYIGLDDFLHNKTAAGYHAGVDVVDSPLMFYCRYMGSDVPPVWQDVISAVFLLTPILACTLATLVLQRKLAR